MLKLKQEDIQYIDTYLEDKGVKYWDIRLEMIDHIACNMESKPGQHEFESLFKDTVQQLGWDKTLIRYEQRQLKQINKIIRKKYFKAVGDILKSFKSLVLIAILLCVYYFLFENQSYELFNGFSMAIVGIPVLYFTGHFAYMTIKKKKSGYLFYSYFYIIFSLLMTNMLYQIPRPDGLIEVSMVTWLNIIFFTTIFNVIFIYSGIKVYLDINQKYNQIDDKLNSI